MRHSNTLKVLTAALLMTIGLGAAATTSAQEPAKDATPVALDGKARPSRVAPPTTIATPRPTDPATILRTCKDHPRQIVIDPRRPGSNRSETAKAFRIRAARTGNHERPDGSGPGARARARPLHDV